jgi:hypothetical protein
VILFFMPPAIAGMTGVASAQLLVEMGSHEVFAQAGLEPLSALTSQIVRITRTSHRCLVNNFLILFFHLPSNNYHIQLFIYIINLQICDTHK